MKVKMSKKMLKIVIWFFNRRKRKLDKQLHNINKELEYINNELYKISELIKKEVI